MIWIYECISSLSTEMRAGSLYISVFSSFNIFPVTTPESIESLTFSAVLPMSIKGSTEIRSPASPTGKPKDESTISAANVAHPPTPATPKELMVIITINFAIKPIL